MPALLVLVALILALPAAATEWTWAGPDGGSVYSLALHPGNPDVLYAGTWTGVFKSVDGGATWRLPVEPRWESTPVFEIAVVPSQPAPLYAVMGNDLFKSTDGGDHWTDVGQSIRPVRRVKVTPGGVVYACAGGGVFRSSDGGATWQGLNRGLPELGRSVQALEIDPSRPERMFAGLDQGLYRTTNGGARWTPVGGAALAGGVIDVAVSPAAPQTVYAATTAGVVRSFDGGATWSLGQVLPSVAVVAAHPSQPQTVYAGTGNGVFKSTDRGKSWVLAGEELAGQPIAALEIDPAGTLWAGGTSGLRLGGVFRSTDGGAHWTFRSRGLSASNLEVLKADPHTPGTLFAGGNFGLLRTRDRGLHWTVLPIPPGTPVSDVEIDPVNPSIVYAATHTPGLFLKSTDGGDSWTSLAGPTAIESLAVDPVNPSVLYGAAFNYGFSKSVDGGVTWVHKPMPLPPLIFLLHVEAAPGILYALAQVFDEPNPRVSRSQTFRSRNGGETWEPLDPNLHFSRLAVSPSDPETVYATGGTGIYRTTDAGDTWQQIGDLAGFVVSLAIAPGPPETLYAAVQRQGVFASTDGGVTWTPVGEGLEGAFINFLAVDPNEPERLYLAVPHRGVAMLYQPEGCETGTATLCLRGRFRVEVAWTDFQGNSGSGQAIPMTHETGGLWFFDPGNVELVVKVLDGRGSNGRFWVFAASLTSVELTLTVTDTETGKQRVYYNPPGHMASFGDTDAF
jgi:photosystem II stability/assembly factor-like uncharacterized protein